MTMVSATTTIPEAEEEDDDDGDRSFFESLDRIPSSVSIDFAVASSSSDTDDDPRVSFASAIATPSFTHRNLSGRRQCEGEEGEEEGGGEGEDYSIWMMAEPMSIEERRQRLLKGMGLSKNRRSELSVTSKTSSDSPSKTSSSDSPLPCPSSASSSSTLLRSRSEAGAASKCNAKRPHRLLRRSATSPAAFGLEKSGDAEAAGAKTIVSRSMGLDRRDTVALYTIKNLDTGKEFVINLENGTWNSKVSDLQTGDQLTMDEFERSLGHSPLVRELMRRECIGPCNGNPNGRASGSSGSSGRKRSGGGGGGGKKKGVSWLKNIKVVANSMTGLMSEKEGGGLTSDRLSGRSQSSMNSPSDWTKVHRRGKPFKELTGMYMSQEIKAHQGSIWCMRFSPDALFMASAGEDREIHVWEVLERDSVSSSQRPLADGGSGTAQLAAAAEGGAEEAGDCRGLRRGKTSLLSRRKSNIPDHVVVPETMFSLSDKPFCSFHGHLDDVLDLSWSKSQYLLSSSMDKTVRLWAMESKTCLKLFAHNDYVTCIQFNPVDDQYFISGSLDAKIRIWSIPDRQVVHWKDLHEMVTAACYTPGGQGALVGSHKGSCHLYSLSGSKLRLKAQLDLHNKKKKSQAKKITGFQFQPGNPSEVMITSADSQIRVLGGVDLIHKFRGFRNTSSQMSASYTPDGHYVVCASEDSHVYVWKREESRHAGAAVSKGKAWVTTTSHESFHCKDVSVAVPWPGSSRHEPPSLPSTRYTHANHHQQSPPSNGHTRSPSIVTCPEDHFSSCRSQCPPPPKKGSPDRSATLTEDELSNPSRTGSGISSTSSGSSSSWLWSGPLSSIHAFSLPGSALSARWYSGGSSRGSTAPSATAWGLVVVTAGLRGEIKVFQNFGLPIRL